MLGYKTKGDQLSQAVAWCDKLFISKVGLTVTQYELVLLQSLYTGVCVITCCGTLLLTIWWYLYRGTGLAGVRALRRF